MRLIYRFGASIGAALSILAAVAIGGSGTAAASPHHHPGPVLVDDINVWAPINVQVIDNVINVLGVIDY